MPLAELQAMRPLEGVKVLFADDDADARYLYSTAFSRAGADVTVATNGVESILLWGRAMSSGLPFDVVVLDYEMRGYGGGFATEVIRDAGYNGAIVGISAVLDPAEFGQWKKLGCDDVFEKSIPLPELISHITTASGARAIEFDGLPVTDDQQEFTISQGSSISEASLEQLKTDVIVENWEWIEAHPQSTLGQLWERLELVVQQCWQQAAHADGPVLDYHNLPEPLASELRLWPVRGEDGQPKTFPDRAVELEGFLAHVARLSVHLGPDTVVSSLAE